MKKLFFFLTMMMTTLSVMADEWSIDFAKIGEDNALSDKAGLQISAEVTKINGVSMGTCTLGEALNSNFLMQTGTSWIYRTGTKGLYSSNGGGRSFGCANCTKGQLITLVISAAPTPSNATLKSNDGNTYIYSVDADGGVAFNLARYNTIYSISVANNNAQTADYTIKYVDGEGNEIKDARVSNGDVSTAASILASDKAAVVKEGTAYLYVSDDSADKTVAEDGSTVVTVVFRVAANYAFKVLAVEGDNTIATVYENSGYETQNISYYFPYYILQDGKLYATNQSVYGTGSLLLDADNKEVKKEYTEEANTNAVFYSEAEDISTLKAYEDGFTQIRMSNGKVAYAEADGAVIATLPAGKYTLTTSSRSGTTNFFVGETNIYTLESTGAVVVGTSEEFTLTKESDITVSAGSTTSYFDYVLIRKTGEYVAPVVENNNKIAKSIVDDETENEYIYDADGNLKLMLSASNLYEYTYNEAGLCTKRQTYSWIAADKVYKKGAYEVYEYDAEGNMTKKTVMKIPYGKTEYVEDDVFQNYVYEDGIAKSWDNYYKGILYYNYRNVVTTEDNKKIVTTEEMDPDAPEKGWKTILVSEYEDGLLVKETKGTTVRTFVYTEYKAEYAPANLTVTAENANVTLSWDAVAGAEKYVVTYDQTSKEVEGTTTTITVGTGDRNFAVQAVIEGAARNASFATVNVVDNGKLPITDLAVGTMTKTTEETESVEAPTRDFFNIPLTWTLPEGHSNVVKYNIYYDSQRYGKATRVSETNPAATGYTLKIDIDEMASLDAEGVPSKGVPSDIYVTVEYETGESEASNVVTVNPFKELGLEEVTPIEMTITNNSISDYTEYGGPIMWEGRDADGNYVTVAFDAEGNLDVANTDIVAADYSAKYKAVSGSGSITANADKSKSLDATIEFAEIGTYHITGVIAAPASCPFDLPTVTATTEKVTIVFDVASAVEGKEGPTLEGAVLINDGENDYQNGFSETNVVDGKVTIEIPVDRFVQGWSNTLSLAGGQEISVSFPEITLYENFVAGGYEKIWTGEMEGSVNVTVVAPAPKPENTELTKDMFFTWTSAGADAEHAAVQSSTWCDYVLNESTGMPYGNGNVDWMQYADISAYEKLVVTATAGTPRFFLNRMTAAGQAATGDAIDTNNADHSAAYVQKVDNGDGSFNFILDIAKIVAEHGFAHLNVIKDLNWAKVTVTRMLLVNGEIPTGINNATVNSSVYGKFIKNGKIVIIKNGKQYNVNGVQVK